MMVNIVNLIAVITCLLFLSETINATINKEVSRTIDAASSIVRVSTEIKIADGGKEYQLIFPDSQANHLSYLSVILKGKLKDKLPISAPVT